MAEMTSCVKPDEAYADAQYLFSEDVLGHTAGHKPRHAKTYRCFNAEYARLQRERVAAYTEFVADVKSGAYPAAEHVVPLGDEEFEAFMKRMETDAYPERKHEVRMGDAA